MVATVQEMMDNGTLDEWWAKREAERKEFSEVLEGLVRKAYRKNLRNTLDYDISYEGQSEQLVRTVAKSRTNNREEPIHIDYEVSKVGGRWLIHNIITEGSSLVRNYRSQFARIIKKKGFPALLERMRKKLASKK